MSKNKFIPKLSVLVSAYNQEKYIGRCLRSLLHQTLDHKYYELIIVDDGSTDKTDYALDLFTDPYDSIIKIIKNQKNIGLPASINKAIKKSSAEYIVRVDADDFVNKNFLNFLLIFLESNSDYDAVSCDYLLVDDNENVFKRENAKNNPIACGILFKKKHVYEIGLYDEKFHYQEDLDFRFRFDKKFKIKNLEIPLYRYRRHKDNITNNHEQMKLHSKYLIEKHGKEILQKK